MRIVAVVLAAMIVAVTAVAYVLVRHAEDAADAERQQDAADAVARTLHHAVDADADDVVTAARLLGTAPVTPQRFAIIAREVLGQPAIPGIVSPPRVPAGERRAYERRTGSPITESHG